MKNINFYPRLLEGAWLDKIYREKFGVEIHDDSKETPSEFEIVATAGKHKTPIVKNPHTLRGIEADVRALGDKDGNLYVSLHDEYFNHGEMANALMDAGLIKTVKYNSKATKVGEVHGVYDDQKNFVLLNRFEDEDIFIPSDCAEWEGEATEKIYRILKRNFPNLQFETDDRYFDYIEDDNDEEFEVKSLKKVSEALNESPDRINVDDKHYEVEDGPGDTYAFEVVFNRETGKIGDVLISNESRKRHGDDEITSGPMSGDDGDEIFYRKDGAYDFAWKKVYPGRLFMEPKVITFWIYPDVNEMKQILDIMSKKLKIDFSNWKIEIYEEGLKNKGEQDYSNNYERDDKSEIIPLSHFIGSKAPNPKEYLQHLNSKIKHDVPYGYGTKNPTYSDKRKWQMASLTSESVNEEVEDKRSGLKKKLIKTFKDAIGSDVHVYFVNGSYVKSTEPGLDFKEFVEGGHHYADSYPGYKLCIPEDEIWVDDAFKQKPEDLKGIILHEFLERNLMKYKKWSYEKAHELANKKEAEFRKRY